MIDVQTEEQKKSGLAKLFGCLGKLIPIAIVGCGLLLIVAWLVVGIIGSKGDAEREKEEMAAAEGQAGAEGEGGAGQMGAGAMAEEMGANMTEEAREEAKEKLAQMAAEAKANGVAGDGASGSANEAQFAMPEGGSDEATVTFEGVENGEIPNEELAGALEIGRAHV